MATLLPNGKQQFVDANGAPLAGGSVAFYVPGTLTPKDSWQDSGATILNTNPITLDASGEAIIYGSGSYRQIVKDASGNQIWDQLTADTAIGGLAWGGTSTGTPNAQIIAASSFSQQDGQQVSFIVGAGLTNTSSTTVTPGTGSGIAILKNTPTGPTSLTGGELVPGNVATLVYDATRGAFLFTDQPVQLVPSGSIFQFAMSTIPSGYLICDGSVISRSTFQALFAVIGTTYGSGDGTTTFGLPDLRGYFLRGWDDGAGRDPGRAIGSTQADAYLNHAHGVTDPGHLHALVNIAWNGGGSTGNGFANAGGNLSATNVNSTSNATGLTVNTSTTGGTETRPKNVALAFAIKT